MNLRSKLVLGFIAVASLIFVTAIVGILVSRQVLTSFNEIVQVTTPSLNALIQMDADSQNLRETAVHHALMRQLNAESVEVEEFNAARDDLLSQVEIYGQIDTESNLHDQLKAAATDYIAAGENLITLANAGANGEALVAEIEALDGVEETFNATREEAIAKEYEDFQSQLSGTQQTSSIARMIFIGSMFVVVAAALVLGVVVSGTIARPVQQLQHATDLMMQGDYSQRVTATTRDEIGDLTKAYNIMADRIQQRDAELQTANQVLEKRVDERTKELRIATREAQEASRLKDEFLSIMSHELRTPLNAIIGFQGIMLMTGKLDERGKHMITRAQANANRLLTLINDILDVSRIESGRMQLVPVEVSPTMLVERLEGQMSVLAEEKHLEFDVDIDPSVPPQILVDEDAITKIITNLLGNAFKFTDQGSVALSLTQIGSNLVIAVKDTGIGIPMHMHQTIFERFRQVDGSSKRVHGGSGLGLAIVQKLCTAMNGTVQVKSVVGEGSTFTVTLPLEAITEKVAS